MRVRYAVLDIFEGALDESVEEINARAVSERHGWNAVPAYEQDLNGLRRLVVSFDSESDRQEFDRLFRRLEVDPQENPGQLALVDVEPTPRLPESESSIEERSSEWKSLPVFVPAPERLTRTVEFFEDAERAAFLEKAGIRTIHKGTRGTLSTWWPDRPMEDLSSLRFVSTGATRPRYPVYVPSRGRWKTPLTLSFLKRDRVPFYVVVEREEREQYERVVGGAGEVLVLPKSGRGLIFARNWIRDHAEALGAERHWQLDDNIGQVRRLYAGRRIPCDSGPALASVEEFADRYANVAIAGLNYQMFVTPSAPPYRTNVHVYSGTLVNHAAPHRWRLLYNDDVDICLQALVDGWATVLVNAFMIDKKTTMTMAGGNTNAGGPINYAGDGRTKMARSLRAAWPNLVTVRRRFGRDQHVVDWSAFTHELVSRREVSLKQDGERGLDLVKVREPESPALRRLFEEYRALRGTPEPLGEQMSLLLGEGISS